MLVAVGGHTRNIGKSSVVAGVIRRLPEYRWIAVKITQYGHGVCAHSTRNCGCEAEPDHPYALSEEFEPGPGDSARFLAAGARRAFWLRTRAGELPAARGVLEKMFAAGPHTIVESNSILDLYRPDLYLAVLDFGSPDFKPSALRHMDRADAFVVIDRGLNVPLWEEVARGLWDAKPHFTARPPHYVSGALAAFVRDRLGPPPAPSRPPAQPA